MKEKTSKFDIRDAATQMWRSRRTIAWWCLGTAIFGVIMAFSIPRKYTVGSALAPEQTGMSGITSLASMVGVNLSGMESTDAIDPSLFPDISETLPFLMAVADSKIRTETDTTLLPYKEYLRRQPKTWYEYVIGFPAYVRNKIKGPKAMPAASDASKEQPYLILSEKESGRLAKMAKNIGVSQNAKTGIITITVSEQDPMVATMLNANIQEVLQAAIVDYKTSKANADLLGYKMLSDQLYQEYRTRQQAYAEFVSKNRSISNEYINAEKDRLQSEMDLTLNSLQQINQQRYVAEATLVEKKPAFVTINPPAFPTQPSNSRVSTVIVWVFLGALISTLWVLFGKHYWTETVSFMKGLCKYED